MNLSETEIGGAPTLLSVSLMGADPGSLGEAVDHAVACGADILHVDVMDGQFAPRFGFDERVTDWLVRLGLLPVEVHLQSFRPSLYVDRFLDSGVAAIGIHVEADEDVAPVLEHIRSRGCRAVLHAAPSTPVAELIPYVGQVDSFGLLSADPFIPAGQFQPEIYGRIAELAEGAGTPRPPIVIDGCLTSSTIPVCLESGATEVVVGREFFSPSAQKVVEAVKLDG